MFSLFYFSCKEKYSYSECETITLNLHNSKAIDIRDSAKYYIRKIPLELNDNSLLTYIDQIEIEGNNIYVYDKHRLIGFDMNGIFLKVIGEKGLGLGEYTNINSFFLKENNIYVYDDNIQTLFTYDKDGTFIVSKKIKEPMYSIYAINDNRYIGRKKYQGSKTKVPTMAILNENLNLISDIKNRYLTSGISVFDYCYSFDNSVLYWEFLNDTIYSVKKSEITPIYYIDFQDFKIPLIEKRNKEIPEIIEYLNSTDSKHATGIRYIQEDVYDIRFIFSFDKKINYARYNKQTKKISSYYFYDSKNIFEIQYFMKYNDGKIILSVYNSDDEESNPILFFIDETKI